MKKTIKTVSAAVLTIMSLTCIAGGASVMAAPATSHSNWGVRGSIVNGLTFEDIAGGVPTYPQTSVLSTAADVVFNNGRYELALGLSGDLGHFKKFDDGTEPNYNHYTVEAHLARVFHFSDPKFTWMLGAHVSYKGERYVSGQSGNHYSVGMYASVQYQAFDHVYLGLSTVPIAYAEKDIQVSPQMLSVENKGRSHTWNLFNYNSIDITWMF